VRRFLILCGILAFVLLVAEAWPAWAGHSYKFDAECGEVDGGGGRTARHHFFDHQFTVRSGRSKQDWRDSTGPGVTQVETGIRFSYRDRGYEEVWLRTDADGWSAVSMDFDADAEVWELTIEVEPGVLSYQFRVRRDDGSIRDRTDPTNPTRRRDLEQGWVSRVEIAPDGEVRLHERDRRREPHLESFDLNLLSGIGADYQRVDGFVLRGSPSFDSRDPWAPAVHSTVGYGFSSERGSGRIYLVQPLAADGWLRAVFSGYDYSDYTDRTAVGDLENSLATLTFREDSRDWYRRKGLGFGVEMEKIQNLLVRLEFRSDDYRSMPKKVVAGWGGREDFLPNPGIDEGIMRSLLLRARWGSDYSHLWLQYENGRSSRFSSAFDFEQIIVQGRLRWQISWAQTLDLRARWGTGLRGELPAQKRFLAGGLGTVRGYNYQSLFTPDVAGTSRPYGGDQLGLFNAEYRLGVHGDFGIGILFDTGMVHESSGALRLGDFRNSLGLALLVGEPGDSSLRLDFIQPLESNGRILVQGRLVRPF
jgi:hypothetical protein